MKMSTERPARGENNFFSLTDSISPYSQAVWWETAECYEIFLAGMGAVDPITNHVAGFDPKTGFESGAMELQVDQIFRMLGRLLDALGEVIGIALEIEGHVYKVEVALRDGEASDFFLFNQSYQKWFPGGRFPVRTTLQNIKPPKEGLLVELTFSLRVPKSATPDK